MPCSLLTMFLHIEVALHKLIIIKSSYNLALYRHDYLLDPFPLVCVLGLSIDDLKALQDVYNVIYSSPFNVQLSGTLIKVEQCTPLTSVEP